MARRVDTTDSAVVARAESSQSFDSTLLTSLVRVVAEWTSAGAQAALAKDAGLTIDPSDIAALFTLGRLGPQRPSLLAQRLRVSPPTVSKILSRLAESDLIQRVADPGDARASVIVLTTQGADAVRKLFDQGDEMVARILAGWAVDDANNLATLLERFADRVDDLSLGVN
jgi:DNA-binding MarR family transcriptional regulator